MLMSIVFFTFSISVLQLLNGFLFYGKDVTEIFNLLDSAISEGLGADKVSELATHFTCWVNSAFTVDVLYGDGDISHFISPVIKLSKVLDAAEQRVEQVLVVLAALLQSEFAYTNMNGADQTGFILLKQFVQLGINAIDPLAEAGEDGLGFGGHFQISSSTL
jgi:hypothetical protein